ncbi:hypothetical protein ACFQZI_03870 [Mucilaginibacter lutimaris]|uniref:Ig-like domain-containing protein n=1 Tax=Mucilaginibacter lutimaris TaxID=931629 RepID=A0ABW2ZB15_9SPHI
MKRLYILAVAMVFPFFVQAQHQKSTIVYTSDIDRFWTAFDSVRSTSDTAKQVQFVQKLYVDKGTEGLKAFMQARDYDAKLWCKLINKYPKFWQSIKANTLSVKGQVNLITAAVQTLKKIYPEMRPAKMYFTIGGLRSGGTTTGDMVLVGAEIATADNNTDASELGDWLQTVFKNQQSSNLVSVNIHEYIHTQQKPGGNTVLVQCIREGAADFIAELVTKKPNKNAYVIYGREHENELKLKFNIDMFSTATGLWLYNGSVNPHADLGYYIGYAICKAYYKQQSNKKQAIKDIIELDYNNEQQVVDFLDRSKYFNKPVYKKQSLIEFEKLQPFVVSIYPAINSQQNVPATLNELTFNFSEPMGKGVSISFGEGGKEHFPLTGAIGFTEDRKSFKVKLSLQSGKSYNFYITGNGFTSQKGYPLKEYKVAFNVQ